MGVAFLRGEWSGDRVPGIGEAPGLYIAIVDGNE